MLNRLPLLALAASALVATLPAFAPPDPPPAAGGWTLVAYNDLGMHCMDSDYSVFSILPPFNNVFAQLVRPNGLLADDTTGITVTYEAVADPLGSMNTSSAGKTNYWTYGPLLYGASPVPDTGLTGNDMPGPGNVPQPMAFDAARNSWFADGIPITPIDDDGHRRTYPLMRLVARNAQGAVLAATTPVLPVSSEMDCRACHGSGAGPAAEPADGWVYAKKAERDYRLNILRLHDDEHLGETTYQDALASKGYSPAGLYPTVASQGVPILCATCHASNALPGTGVAGIPPLTAAVHARHASVVDPASGMILDASDNRSACYTCHPGSDTRCLRGAMGAAVAPDGELSMQCQGCHGSMSAVGSLQRVGWLDQPTCQACHTGTALSNNGQIRYTDALLPDGSLRQAVNPTFATDPDVPAAGFSLYRFSDGHGGLHCSSCHGSTHAEYPALHPNDNLAPDAIQGHAGTLVECDACHVANLVSITGGPHGMHSVGQIWVDEHHELVDEDQTGACRACHGTDFRGTVLSMAQGDRTLFTEDFGTKTYFDGARVSCYGCHNGPTSSSTSLNGKPAALDRSLTVGDTPAAVGLLANDPDGDPLTLRIVGQPAYGRVGLVGSTATYHPDPGFAGTDTFTYAAWDGKLESNLATVTVTRLSNWGNYSYGYPGTGGVVPELVSDVNPVLGQTVQLSMGNTSGSDAFTFFFLSLEQAQIDTKFGGTLLTEPTVGVSFVLPAAGVQVPWTVPVDPAVTGATLRVQTIQQDPGAVFGFAFSRGLRLTVGP